MRSIRPTRPMAAVLLFGLLVGPLASALAQDPESEEASFPLVTLKLTQASFEDVVAELARLGDTEITVPRDVDGEPSDYDFVDVEWDRILQLVATIHQLVAVPTEKGWTLREPIEGEKPGLATAAAAEGSRGGEILRLADVPAGRFLKLGDVPRTEVERAPITTRFVVKHLTLPRRNPPG